MCKFGENKIKTPKEESNNLKTLQINNISINDGNLVKMISLI